MCRLFDIVAVAAAVTMVVAWSVMAMRVSHEREVSDCMVVYKSQSLCEARIEYGERW